MVLWWIMKQRSERTSKRTNSTELEKKVLRTFTWWLQVFFLLFWQSLLWFLCLEKNVKSYSVYHITNFFLFEVSKCVCMVWYTQSHQHGKNICFVYFVCFVCFVWFMCFSAFETGKSPCCPWVCTLPAGFRGRWPCSFWASQWVYQVCMFRHVACSILCESSVAVGGCGTMWSRSVWASNTNKLLASVLTLT